MRLPPLLIIGILFFVFGFISWINAILIPYFQISCELSTSQAMMVPFAFYFSYFLIAIPASFILGKIGFKNGMVLGLFIMSAGALVFLSAAAYRVYPIFLTGLFIMSTGLTILQTASNPYVTILGPIESAAKRISLMGVCNKLAGAIAPLILVQAITRNPDEIDQLKNQLPLLTPEQKTSVLNELSSRLILPYVAISVVLLGLGLMIRYAHLPDIEESGNDGLDATSLNERTSIFKFPYLLLGALTCFCSVSVEVLVVDSIINYGRHAGFSFRAAKFLATDTLILMIASYLLGIAVIPRYIKQRKVLQYSAIVGLLLSVIAVLIRNEASVWFICALGLCNALLWPSVWPLAIDGLGKYTKQGSALMIMGIIGGALTPLAYGYVSDKLDPQRAYWLLVPCYVFILFYAVRGYAIGKYSARAPA
jgi:glucose/galactose transporter